MEAQVLLLIFSSSSCASWRRRTACEMAGRDDGQEAHVVLEGHAFVVRPVGGQGADHFTAYPDGHTDEGDIPLVNVLPRPCSVEKEGLIGDIGNHDGLARIDHLPRDALAHSVPAPRLFIGTEAVGLLYRYLSPRPIEYGEGTPRYLHMPGN